MSVLNRVFTQSTSRAIQKFAYLLVLDFEATCDNQTKLDIQEIIEFPTIVINSKTLECEHKFHHYVRPVVYPELTDFCCELTGIIQSMVEDQPTLPETLKMFDEFLESAHLKRGMNSSCAFVTCGNWDLAAMLPGQCKYLGIQVPDYFKQWINVKEIYARFMGHYPRGMMSMLDGLQLKHVGRHHSGIDDCQNIANIVRELICRGAVFEITGENKLKS